MPPMPARRLAPCLVAIALCAASAWARAAPAGAPGEASTEAPGAAPAPASADADQPVPHGVWRFRQARADQPVRCNYTSPRLCTQHRLAVENESDDTLECDSFLAFVGPGSEGVQSTRSRRVIATRRTRTVLLAISPDGILPTRVGVQCHARTPLPALAVPPGCAYKLLQAPPLDAFYPDNARRIGEQGPVDLEFTVAAGDARASAITVIGSSLSPVLDAAATRYLGALRFEAHCPATRFRLKVEYKLSD